MENDDKLNDTMEDSSEDFDDDCLNKLWGFWIEGVAVPAIAVFGIIGTVVTGHTNTRDVTFLLSGNIFCVFVFNHKSVDLKPSFSNILKCLSIFDIATLVRTYYTYL